MPEVLGCTLEVGANVQSIALALVAAVQGVVIARYARQSRRARIQLKTKHPSSG